jgi:hypothetical protein
VNADRCDAHGFCWSCLQQYVEIKIMDNGCWNLACPGVGCKYHLVSDDIELILRGSRVRDKALEQYKSLCSQSGNSRMLEALVLALEDKKRVMDTKQLASMPKMFASSTKARWLSTFSLPMRLRLLLRLWS